MRMLIFGMLVGIPMLMALFEWASSGFGFEGFLGLVLLFFICLWLFNQAALGLPPDDEHKQ